MNWIPKKHREFQKKQKKTKVLGERFPAELDSKKTPRIPKKTKKTKVLGERCLVVPPLGLKVLFFFVCFGILGVFLEFSVFFCNSSLDCWKRFIFWNSQGFFRKGHAY